MTHRHGFTLAIVIWLLVLAGLSIGAIAVPAQNDSGWLYGIHWYADPDPDNGGSVEDMTGDKGIWVLETLMTEDKNPAPWAWGLEAQFDKFERAHTNGHTLIIRIQPSWEMVVPGPGEMEAFLVDVKAAAARLADIAHIWQIGNEMQLEGGKYWNRTGEELTAELYVEKYKQIRNAIKSVASSLGPQIVLLGPVAAGNTAYLGEMCDALTEDDVDGFAIHAYGGSHGGLIQQVADQTSLIDHKGFSRKPIYMTEWGDRVDPALSPTSIENVADFLRHSFEALARYNATPSNHPIVGACWFVYNRSDQWQRWSILGLHDANVTNDLYNAFRQVAAFDLPAGNDFSADSPQGLFIGRSPTVLNAVILTGQDAPDATFTVYRTGIGPLNYTIAADADWLYLTPAGGTADGDVDMITVGYSTAALSPGQYTGTITINDPEAINTPQTVGVNLMVQSNLPAPAIVNPNFEDDGGGFGVAKGWQAYGGNKWESIWDPQLVWTQGIADIAPQGRCGVYQTIQVTPGGQYRLTAEALSQTPAYALSIGVNSKGNANHADATFSTPIASPHRAQLVHEFVASHTAVTIFLDGHNTSSQWIHGRWGLFDNVAIEVLGSGNLAPTADATASPTDGEAPLTVLFDGSSSSDPDNDALSYSWDFNDGSVNQTGVTTSHTFETAGFYNVTLTVDDDKGGTDSTTLTISVTEPGTPSNLIINGDFFDGLKGWTLWTERGSINAMINNAGQLHVQSADHNGGLYQSFRTGGAGTPITIHGTWASDPTVANHQWAEVLIINGPRQPVNGQDIHAGQGDAVLIYKNDTWATPGGWSGQMHHTAAVHNTAGFVAAGDTATIVLKSGNLTGAISGTRYDNLVVSGESSGNRSPVAIANATPLSGQSPLTVNFDATESSDPDGDQLVFRWDFGDGTMGNGPNISHTYQESGTYAITLLVDDGRQGTDTDVLSILVTDPGSPTGPSKLTIHTSFLGPASWAFLEHAQPAVVKILDEIKVEVTQGVKDKSPHTLVVGRIWYDAWQRLGDGSPEARAQEWWEDLKGTILANPAVDYWEGYNEPVIHDPALMQWYAYFEKKRIEILAAHGHRACIGNFSTGMPPAEREVWEAFYPAIDAALANGGVLGLHEYSAPDMDWLFDYSGGEGWLTGRYRKVYRQFLIPDGRVIPLIITECGIDGGVLGNPDDINRGWRSYQSPEGYFEQLKWYDSLLKEDSYVLGATIFSLEIHNWGDFDISGRVFELLTDYVRSSRQPSQ